MYQASDLLDDDVCEKKIKAHLDQLVALGESMPVEHNGFNYGELENGIYTDIRGTGSLKFKATVANSTSQPFTFYPMDYIAQVGSGVSDESESVVYYATASTTQKQRVTIEPNDEIEVEDVEEETIESPTKQQIDAARRLNDLLRKFPGSAQLPVITPDMIVIDPNADYIMGWQTWSDPNRGVCGVGRFVIRDADDIYDYGKYAQYNFVHELSHYYHDRMFSGVDGYRQISDKDKATAEGFATLMGMKLSGENVVQNTCGADTR